MRRFILASGGLVVATWLWSATPAAAHCDTMSGPVVQDARIALEKKDVTPVLKWIRPDDEKEIHALFEKTLAVRTKGTDAKELADRLFFETLVRVHRAGEGAPFTGLKPEGTEVEPGVAAADQALQHGSADPVVEMVTHAAGEGIRDRYEKVAAAKAHKDDSVEAGRRYVAAYVNFVHYVEGVLSVAGGKVAEDEHGSAAPAAHKGEGHAGTAHH